MKLNISLKHITSVLAAGMMLGSCSDFTDIDPKGKNLLTRTADLELLLNADYSLSSSTLQEISGDIFDCVEPLAPALAPPVKTSFSIIAGWDEAGHENKLPELTNSDSYYAGCYEYIGRIANPIISMVDNADGQEADKTAIKAEAYLIRAYFHFLAAQKFAPAYDKATAAGTVGLAYMLEGQDIKQSPEPIMLDKYYDNILADINTAISLDALPEVPVNAMRFGKASAYAVKALVLMSMQEPGEAAIAAQKALDIKSIVVDYNTMLSSAADAFGIGTYPVLLRPKLECAEDYFSDNSYTFLDTILTMDKFETGHAIPNYLNSMNRMYAGMMDPSLMFLGVPGLVMTNDLNSSWPHIGLKTTQMYLILAENAIENGLYDDAMDYLDKIRVCRIDPAVYAPLKGTVNDKATAIARLKTTAHGEGIFSVWNFIDRKRWTRLADYRETVTRTFCDIDMTLTPDSKMWVFPIPQNVVNNNPNMKPYLNW